MSKLKIELKGNAFENVGVAIKDVEYGTVVVRVPQRTDTTEPTVYLVASPMDTTGEKALVTLGGGTLKRVAQDTRVFPVEAQLSVGAEPLLDFKTPHAWHLVMPSLVGVDLGIMESRLYAAMNTKGTETGRFTASEVNEVNNQRERNYISSLERKCDELQAKAEHWEDTARVLANDVNEREDKLVELDRMVDALEAAQDAQIAGLKQSVREAFHEIYDASGWSDTIRKVLRRLHNALQLDKRTLNPNG